MNTIVVVLFVLSYAGISARRVNVLPVGRPAMALLGACAVVTVGEVARARGDASAFGIDDGLRAIEPHTLALLFGMMIVAAGLSEGGLFTRLVDVVAAHVRSRAALLWIVCVGAGLLSALLVNDAVCLLGTPVVVLLARRARADVVPFLFATAMGANAGSALTLAGNPQNMLVAQLSSLSYRGYLVDVLVPGGLALVVTAALLHAIFRRRLAVDVAEPPTAQESTGAPADALLVAGVVAVVGVAVANAAGVSLSLSALAGATIVILTARERTDRLFALVDWTVLVFFAGLFVLVGALQHTGVAAQVLARVPASSTEGIAGVLTLSSTLLLGSQVVSNVPLILLLRPWIASFADQELAWTLTALVSTLAGNLTLLGSVANIIVFERARARVGFVAYAAVGVPVTLVSMVVAVGVLLVLR